MQSNIYLTAGIRWVGALMYIPAMPCDILYTEKFEGIDGIGFNLSFGKEWLSDDSDWGVGLGLLGNYVLLTDTMNIHYLSIMLGLTVTKF